MKLSRDIPSRLARLTFTVMMGLAWCGGANPAPTSAAPADASREPTPQDLQRAADGVEKAMKAAAEFDKQLPRDTFDPQEIAGRAGQEPKALLDWMIANTRWVAYDGALRGSAGVLMDRQGNSLDRSLLLVQLLRLSGKTARLAYAKLSDEQARAFLQNAQRPREQKAAPPPARDDAAINAYANSHGISADGLRHSMAQMALRSNTLAQNMAQRVADARTQLTRLIPPPAQQANSVDPARAIAEHWWVQCRQGSEWIDLDPMAPPGAQKIAATQTVDVPENGASPALDSNLWHQVEVRTVIEQWDGHQLKQTPVLTRALRPADLIDKRVSFQHVPLQWPSNLNLLGSPDPLGRLRNAILAQQEWVPILVIGDERVMQSGFTEAGAVDPKPQLDAMAQAGGSVKKSVTGALGAFDLGADQPQAKPPDTVLTAEWLEFEVKSPGQQSRTYRRQVFDLLGPAARASGKPAIPQITDATRLERGLSLLGQTTILPLGCQLSPAFVAHLGIADSLRQQQTLVKVLREESSMKPEDLNAEVAKLSRMPCELYGLAVCRAAWNSKGADTYLAQPNLFCEHNTLRLDGERGLLLRRTLDIVDNNVEVRSGSAAEAFAARMEQGIVDTEAEAMLLSDPDRSHSAADLFARAGAQGIGWHLLRGAPDPAWQQAGLPADARARIEQDLRDGYGVVAPEKAIDSAAGKQVVWWRVDLARGNVVGMGESGEGPTMVEYAALIIGIAVGVLTMGGCGGFAEGVSAHKAVLCIGCAVIAGVLAAALVLEIAAAAAAAQATGLAMTLSGPAAWQAIFESVVEAGCNAIDWGMK